MKFACVHAVLGGHPVFRMLDEFRAQVVVDIIASMDFSVQLSAYYPGHELGGKRLYQNMLDQAVLADRLGFDAVSITEHHYDNMIKRHNLTPHEDIE